ncbi:uncharacterized protein LOC142167433 [Nicotiana tabacum]|uniref:Uncharacterized protein LOC142167433 n=1 Tax=Nicotiana tabacum TaxID=4097 RepID=A0AC58SFE5_TOBAC
MTSALKLSTWPKTCQSIQIRTIKWQLTLPGIMRMMGSCCPRLSPRKSPLHHSREQSPQWVARKTSATTKLTQFINTQNSWGQQINKVIISLMETMNARTLASPRVYLTTTPQNYDTEGLPNDARIGGSEAMKVLRAKKHGKMRKIQRIRSCEFEARNPEQDKDSQAIKHERQKQRPGMSNSAAASSKSWRPSLQSISESSS